MYININLSDVHMESRTLIGQQMPFNNQWMFISDSSFSKAIAIACVSKKKQTTFPFITQLYWKFGMCLGLTENQYSPPLYLSIYNVHISAFLFIRTYVLKLERSDKNLISQRWHSWQTASRTCWVVWLPHRCLTGPAVCQSATWTFLDICGIILSQINKYINKYS